MALRRGTRARARALSATLTATVMTTPTGAGSTSPPVPPSCRNPSVNGAEPQRLLFPHSFITFSSEELPDFDGRTYASDSWPGILLRSQYAPVIDKITLLPFSRYLLRP